MHLSTNTADLTTDRLVLRPWSADEVAAVTDGITLPHWAEDFPAPGERMIACRIAGGADGLHEYAHRQIIERDTGLVVGGIGLFWPVDGAVEFGYGVVPSRQRRGYATEAARAIVAFALAAPGVRQVGADVDPANAASVRVLRKAGLRCLSTDVRSPRSGQPVHRYAATADDLPRR